MLTTDYYHDEVTAIHDYMQNNNPAYIIRVPNRTLNYGKKIFFNLVFSEWQFKGLSGD
jgi:hypothetical protein